MHVTKIFMKIIWNKLKLSTGVYYFVRFSVIPFGGWKIDPIIQIFLDSFYFSTFYVFKINELYLSKSQIN